MRYAIICFIAVSITMMGVSSYSADLTLQSGLWVGTVTVKNVSVLTSKSPQPTETPFTFRIILNVDKNGTARFLQHANILSNSDSSNLIIATDNYVKNSDKITGRVTSVGFSFSDPILMSWDTATSTYQCTIKMAYDDPLNPFKHRYHPDHNNLNSKYKPLGAGEESWGIKREISLQVTSNQDDTSENELNSENRIALRTYERELNLNYRSAKGTYNETLGAMNNVPGLASGNLFVMGSFRLSRIRSKTVLNPTRIYHRR